LAKDDALTKIIHSRSIFTPRQSPSVGSELGTISIIEQDGRSCAYWCGVGDASDVFLCSVDAAIYNAHAKARELLMALAAEAASHREHAVVVGKTTEPLPWWASLPCARCNSVQAQDVLHRARQALELAELQVSPSGYPAGCCKIRVLGVINPSA
jgi:hypothetical protein